MQAKEFFVKISLDLDKALYVYLSKPNEVKKNIQKKVAKTVRVADIVDLKKTLDINIDFDSDGFVIGIEILT